MLQINERDLKKTYNAVLGTGIPELLMHIISCHGFMNKNYSSAILSCRNELVSYYLQFFFVLHYYNPNAFNNVPIRVKQRINT